MDFTENVTTHLSSLESVPCESETSAANGKDFIYDYLGPHFPGTRNSDGARQREKTSDRMTSDDNA